MDNYDLFKSTMFQRNVELELEAVNILEKQLGKPLDIYRCGYLNTLEQQRAMEEERMLQETLETTAKESNSKDEEMKMDKRLQQILDETAKCEEQLVQQESKPVPAQGEETDKEPVASGGVEEGTSVFSEFLSIKPAVEVGAGEVVDLSGEDEMEEWVQNALGCSMEAITPEMYQQMPPIVQALVRPLTKISCSE